MCPKITSPIQFDLLGAGGHLQPARLIWRAPRHRGRGDCHRCCFQQIYSRDHRLRASARFYRGDLRKERFPWWVWLRGEIGLWAWQWHGVRKCEVHGKQACGGLGDEQRETHWLGTQIWEGSSAPPHPVPGFSALGADLKSVLGGTVICKRVLCSSTYFPLPQPDCHSQDSSCTSNNQLEKVIENQNLFIAPAKATAHLGINPTEDSPKPLGNVNYSLKEGKLKRDMIPGYL